RQGNKIRHQAGTKTGYVGQQSGQQGGKMLKTKKMVQKKGLEPPHPCGYMDLNHARLPIPPLRQVNYSAVRAALKEDTAASILTRHGLSVKPGPAAGLYEQAWPMQIRARGAVKMSEKPAIRAKAESQKSKQETEKIVV